MFERVYTLKIKRVNGVFQWTLFTKHGRMVTMGAARSLASARRTASRHLPYRGRITKIEVVDEQV